MALESAQFINQLVASNPLSTDTVAQADDHLRLIKSVLKTTFPNITGAVTATQDQLNNPLPTGGIIMWSGSVAPNGWALCNGTNGTPDLRNRFIVGAGTTYPLNTYGGSTISSASGAHTHTMDAAGSHIHSGSTGVGVTTGASSSVGFADTGTGHTHTITADGGHTHAVNTIGNHTHTVTPPYYALAFIMKV